MSFTSGLAALADGSILSPFSRLRALLDGVAPGITPAIDLTLGEPRETMPGFVAQKMVEAETELAKYPPIRGTDGLRGAISDWTARRYGEEARANPASEILPCNGSREGLFYACFPAIGRKAVVGRPAALMCNPFYQAYFGAALAAGCEPVFLNATERTGQLPDLDEIAGDEALLRRTACFYLCSPANPQGAVASKDYIARALELARTYNFMLLLDECYSEIYGAAPPPGGLEVAAEKGDRFRNLVVFNSLSKRSNLPGLRSGFCAGDAAFLAMLFEFRNLAGPQMPGPTQHASAAVWADEAHVVANRAAYQKKFEVCDEVLRGRFGYARPGGGFFLWLDVSQIGEGSDAALTLWKRLGVKVIPGAYLAQAGRDGTNPGANYVRLALVHDTATVRQALERLVHVSA